MFEAYVVNKEQYNEGELIGENLLFPAEKEDLQALFARIGVDGVINREFFILDYKTEIAGIRKLGESESIDELNYLASLLSEMEIWELEKFEAASGFGEHSGNAKRLINLALNLDYYDYFKEIHNEEDLGRYLIEDLEVEEVPDRLKNYFNFNSYGRDFSISAAGQFINGGYLIKSGEKFIERYNGRNVPEKYKIFAYPDPPDKMPIKAQLEMYGRFAALQKVCEHAPILAER